MAKINILCVDDQREVLATLKKDLQIYEPAFSIQTTESSAEADELLDDLLNDGEQVALIICDHIMPGENGIDFLCRINADERLGKMKKILLTGLATHADTIRAINEAKINFYTEKPWDDEELFTAIKRLLREYLIESGNNPTDFEVLND